MARSMRLARDMYIVLLLHLAWALMAVPVVTRQQRVPASAATWLALILLLPVAGTLLYILAGYRRNGPAADCPACRGDRLEQIIAHGCGTRPTRYNRVGLLHNGNNAFTALIASLQRATRSIHMEYYIIRDDRIGHTIAEILIRKARAGLEVRVIYDAVGSWRLSRKTLRRMHDAGVETAAFEPVRFPWFTTRVTHRNHRKIVVTDGKVAYLGGINIAKYYLDGDYMGKWRDEHLRVEGDAVADLQRLFIADWARVRGEYLDSRRYIAPHGIRRRLPIQLAWAEEGPSRLTIADAFASAIVRAHRTVRISSPYFLPPCHVARRAPAGSARRGAGTGDDPLVQRLAVHRPDFRLLHRRPARRRGRTLPLRQRLPARQAADRRRGYRLGRHGEHGLPQPAGQPRSHGFHPRPERRAGTLGHLRRRPGLVPPDRAGNMAARGVAAHIGRRAAAGLAPDVAQAADRHFRTGPGAQPP